MNKSRCPHCDREADMDLVLAMECDACKCFSGVRDAPGPATKAMLVTAKEVEREFGNILLVCPESERARLYRLYKQFQIAIEKFSAEWSEHEGANDQA